MTSLFLSNTPRPNPDAFLSPPPSPFSDPEPPVIATDDLGMIADDECSPGKAQGEKVTAVRKKRKAGGKRRNVTYVSRHFVQNGPKDGQGGSSGGDVHNASDSDLKTGPILEGQYLNETTLATPPVTPARPRPRIYHGFNIDDLSSDSSLTDVPEDIGPDPFSPEPPSPGSPTKVQAVKVQPKKTRRPTKSPYFPSPHKHRPTFLSTLPFPPLIHDTLGLMQERLAHDPFRLLIATIFLNKTPGERAMPVFYQLMSRYPTPNDLANAEVGHITSIIYGLGFQNQRARKCVAMAKMWIERPPECGKRYKKQNYPLKGDGREIKKDEVLDDNDDRVAWEISHLPGLGPYSHDSWRMFCRDELRGLAKNWKGEGARDSEKFEPEWKRVIPLDKELRAYLTWMWLKEGWIWNKETGRKTKASADIMSMASGGGIVVEEKDSAHLIVKGVELEKLDQLKGQRQIERTAGEYLPQTSDTAGLDVKVDGLREPDKSQGA